MNPDDISIDWFPEDQDGFIKIRVRALDYPDSLDFKMRPSVLSEIDRRALEQLDPFRNHDASADIETIVWLAHISLCQAHPEFSYEDRNAEIRRLLSSCGLIPKTLIELIGSQDSKTGSRKPMRFEADKPIPKLSYFMLEGRRRLCDIGYQGLFEITRHWPFFGEARGSWEIAVSKFNVGTPRLKTDSPQEAEELTKFAIQLRFENVQETLEQYSDLIKRRKYDKDFTRWMGKTIHFRDKSNRTQLSLEYYVLLFWIHGFLWAIEPLSRADVIFYGFDAPIKQPTAEAIRKIVFRRKLKGCEHFRHTYPQAPIKFIYDKRDRSSHFDYPAKPGQEFPLPKEDSQEH